MFWKRNKDEVFKIEFYPASKHYYATCNGKYMRTNMDTGIVELVNKIDNVWSWNLYIEETCALHLIDLYKEQKHKNNVIIKDVK